MNCFHKKRNTSEILVQCPQSPNWIWVHFQLYRTNFSLVKADRWFHLSHNSCPPTEFGQFLEGKTDIACIAFQWFFFRSFVSLVVCTFVVPWPLDLWQITFLRIFRKQMNKCCNLYLSSLDCNEAQKPLKMYCTT